MNFKNFIYFCALCGAWAALIAWLLVELLGFGSTFKPGDDNGKLVFKATVVAAVLGLLLAGVIGFLDALMNATGFQRIIRASMCMAIGLVGSLIGGAVGQLLAFGIGQMMGIIIGWIIVGVIIGSSIGIFDLLRAMQAGKGSGQAMRKVINGIIGGTLGGALGGFFSVSLDPLKDHSPKFIVATGLVILGACVGLLIGLAQVLLKEAWVRVEQGFKAGREMILTKPDTTIGRAEGMDIALFGDQQCEKLHAHIVLKGDRYVLVDSGTPGGTYVNNHRINGQAPLKSGDMIRVGKSLLRFEERAKRN